MSEKFEEFFSAVGLFSLALIILVGSIWAFTRGGNDFSVFYEAWKLVLSGQGNLIYRVSPDRFLYSPGFAWVLAPVAFFPKPIALGIWCFAKAALVGFLVKKLSSFWKYRSIFVGLGVSAWGFVLIAKPLLIDFEYGQVNLFILGACAWSLLGHFEKRSSPILDFVRWFVLAFVAVAKLYPTPLLFIPWVVTNGLSKKKLHYEKMGILAAVALSSLLPLFSLGWESTFQLFIDWREAVLARGLPLESHNQSFTALLYHYLSGETTAVMSEGQALLFGISLLSADKIVYLSLFWTMTTMGLILGWILRGAVATSFEWIAILIGLLIIPSHLIWKPYFVMSSPLAIWLVHHAFSQKRMIDCGLVAVLFIGINLTGFDFIGHHWASHFESASVLLIMHLVLLSSVYLSESHERLI